MSSVTSKGQVTVPLEIREKLALEAGTRLRWLLRDDGVVEVTREDERSLDEVAGMLRRPDRPEAKTTDEMDRGVARAVTARDRASRARRR